MTSSHHPAHHPGDELLMDYAAGSLPEAHALVVATHLALCPACRHAVAEYEALGGALLEGLPPAALSDGCLASILPLLGEPPPPGGSEPKPVAVPGGRDGAPHARHPVLPEPLRSYAGGDVDDLAWKPAFHGIDEIDLRVGTGGTCTRLMRIRAGAAMPRHGHRGIELMMVLTGSVTEIHVGATDHFRRGDVALALPGVVHEPVAGEGEDCICILVVDAPIQLVRPPGHPPDPVAKS